MQNRVEAENAVKAAFERRQEAADEFAIACHEAHRFLSDEQISRVLGNHAGFSRSSIQSLRKRAEALSTES